MHCIDKTRTKFQQIFYRMLYITTLILEMIKPSFGHACSITNSALKLYKHEKQKQMKKEGEVERKKSAQNVHIKSSGPNYNSEAGNLGTNSVHKYFDSCISHAFCHTLRYSTAINSIAKHKNLSDQKPWSRTFLLNLN